MARIEMLSVGPVPVSHNSSRYLEHPVIQAAPDTLVS